MKPQKEIGKHCRANVNLLPGSSGAEQALWAYYNKEAATFTTRWKLNWKERMMILLHGSVWLSVIGSSHPPVRLDPVEPEDLL